MLILLLSFIELKRNKKKQKETKNKKNKKKKKYEAISTFEANARGRVEEDEHFPAGKR